MATVQRSLLTSRKTYEGMASYNPVFLEKPYRNDPIHKVVGIHRCVQCKHWCKVKYIDKGYGCLQEASSCCGAKITFERYEQKSNNKV